MRRIAAVLLASILVSPAARADEGMWTFNNFPSEQVKQKYGFEPTQSWLDRVRLSSVRLAGGCSGSFVSPSGLVMTNHHCAHRCIEQLSTAERDFVATGFYAATAAQEVRCPEIEINQLVEITDVTPRIEQATAGLTDRAFNDAQKAAMARIEKECATSDQVRCDVVTLYHGGRYDLYKYRRYQDVRLAFAPELAIAFFGGDPDNFNFPRYDLDVSFLRVYENGKPLNTRANYLPFSTRLAENELVFVSGHPGGTSRLDTIAQLEFERDVTLPRSLLYSAELRGILSQMQTESPERRRISETLLFYVENSYKARRGRLQALLDEHFWAELVRRESTLRQQVAADPKLDARYTGAWEEVALAMTRYRDLRDRHVFVEEGRGFMSDLYTLARNLVRASEELQKPNEARLREYVDSRLPALKQKLFSAAPIYDDLEITTLSFSFEKMREALGVDDPFVRKMLGKQSPRELATDLVRGTRLRDVKFRRALFEGGPAAIKASEDPMIRFARTIDPDARAVRKQYEDEVESVVKRSGEQIAKAQFAVYGTSTYPDATFTLRLSFGQVKGWKEADRQIPAFTTIGGAFERATGRDPFRLPESWLTAKPKLVLATPFDVATTNDIIGGNSGSPLINQKGQAVGLIFDGNLPSLAGDYGYDPATNRAIAVDSAAIVEALGKIYGAQRLVEELR